MKSLEEMLQVQPIQSPPPTSPVSDSQITEKVDVQSEDVPVESPPEEPDIPDRLYTDPEVVGYVDEQSQYDIYQYAIQGNIPLTGAVKILDIGCGRGDFFITYRER